MNVWLSFDFVVVVWFLVDILENDHDDDNKTYK